MNKKSVIGVLVGAMALSVVTLSWGGGIYRWVDEKGVTHFGEKPPAPGVGEKIRVNSQNPSSTPKQESDASTPNSSADAGKGAPSEPALDPEVAKAQAEITKKNCEIYTTNLRVLKESARIREAAADGQVKMLSEEEKQSRIKEAEKYLADNCQKASK